MSRKPAQLSVFLSMIFVCICVLLCGFLESARTAGAKWYLQLAMNSAIDSLFSHYHKQMWQEYYIFGVPFTNVEDLNVQILKYFIPYMEGENWYPMQVDQIGVDHIKLLTDEDGQYFEQEVLDYMKYGVWNKIENFSEKESLVEKLNEAEKVQIIINDFCEFAVDMIKLEEILEEIESLQRQQKEQVRKASQAILQCDGYRLIRLLEKIQKLCEQLPKLVDKYCQYADGLLVNMTNFSIRFEQEILYLSENTIMELRQHQLECESYILADGNRRQQVEALILNNNKNKQLLNQIKEEAMQILQYIEEWEGEDELDQEEMWMSLEDKISGFAFITFDFQHGIEDEEKKQWLQEVKKIAELRLLSFVLPDNQIISSEKLVLNEAPSHKYYQEGGDDQTSIADKIIINEYCDQVFSNYLNNNQNKIKYELEYLISGMSTDNENLENTLQRVLLIRSGLNFLYLLTDQLKRQEARGLALLIAGGTGTLVLVNLLTYFILSIWAIAEGIIDLKILLNEEKVPLLKDSSSWELGMNQFLQMGRDSVCKVILKGNNGYTYDSYIKLLLLLEPSKRKYYRMMDLIQMNIRDIDNSFYMDKAIYYVGLKGRIWGKHVFLALPFVKNYSELYNYHYKLYCETEKAY